MMQLMHEKLNEWKVKLCYFTPFGVGLITINEAAVMWLNKHKNYLSPKNPTA